MWVLVQELEDIKVFRDALINCSLHVFSSLLRSGWLSSWRYHCRTTIGGLASSLVCIYASEYKRFGPILVVVSFPLSWNCECLSKPVINALFFLISFIRRHCLRHHIAILLIQDSVLFSKLIASFIPFKKSSLIMLLLIIFLDGNLRGLVVFLMKGGPKCLLDSHSITLHVGGFACIL